MTDPPETITLEEHKKRLSEARKENKEVVDTLLRKVADAERAAALNQQEYWRTQNDLEDLGHVHKGVVKFFPDSFKNSILIVDALWENYKHPWLMYKRVHQKNLSGVWWKVGLLVIGSIVAVGLFFTPTGAELGSALSTPPNNYIALVAIVLVAVIVLFTRRRQAKPAG